MPLNKKEKLALRQNEFCLKYLKDDWDGCAANSYFANKYDGNIEETYKFKPKTEFHNSIKEIEIAESSLNGALAPMAFTKEEMVEFLMLLNVDNVYVPKEIRNSEEYVKNYLSVSRQILENIKNQVYSFQRPVIR